MIGGMAVQVALADVCGDPGYEDCWEDCWIAVEVSVVIAVAVAVSAVVVAVIAVAVAVAASVAVAVAVAGLRPRWRHFWAPDVLKSLLKIGEAKIIVVKIIVCFFCP